MPPHTWPDTDEFPPLTKYGAKFLCPSARVTFGVRWISFHEGPPPMTNDNAHRGAPQDRQKAIVDAAVELASAMSVRLSRTGARLFVDNPQGDAESALASLFAALALPEPEWTTKAPEEPGVYWMRMRGPKGELRAPEVVNLYSSECAEVFGDVTGGPYYFAEDRRVGWTHEFWPLPVAPPSTGGTNR